MLCIQKLVTSRHSTNWNTLLNSVQYRALKIIAKDYYLNCSRQYLHDIFQIQTICERLHEITRKYCESAILNNNQMIMIIEMLNEITHSSERKNIPVEASF